MLIRHNQIRTMLALIHEAREIGPGMEQKLHLVAGIQRILGAAMTTLGMLRNLGDPRRRKLLQEVSTPSDRAVRVINDAMRTNSKVSSAVEEVSRLLRGTPMVTARRRELLPDGDWDRSEAFNALHPACGVDDYVYSFRALEDGCVSGFAVRRSVGDRPFGEEERNLLELFHEEVARLERAPRPHSDGPRLTPRERQVLQALLRGASEKEVASELD